VVDSSRAATAEVELIVQVAENMEALDNSLSHVRHRIVQSLDNASFLLSNAENDDTRFEILPARIQFQIDHILASN
jgi:hypothetical protein